MNEQQILNDELQLLKSDVIVAHERAGQVASGKTRDAFSVDVQDFAGQLKGASYVGVLQKGRKPGGVPKDFIEILRVWAKFKNISFQDEKQFNIWANGVKWKIIREGTKLYRSGQQKDIFDTPIQSFQTRLSSRVVAYYQESIANEIFNF